jgi:hypothetical protein
MQTVEVLAVVRAVFVVPLQIQAVVLALLNLR